MTEAKHKFRTMEPGTEYTVDSPPTWLKSAVYEYGKAKDKKFTITKVTRGDPWSPIVIRRTA
jgi:hypothetical protein